MGEARGNKGKPLCVQRRHLLVKKSRFPEKHGQNSTKDSVIRENQQNDHIFDLLCEIRSINGSLSNLPLQQINFLAISVSGERNIQ
jgi:hypothetical protein